MGIQMGVWLWEHGGEYSHGTTQGGVSLWAHREECSYGHAKGSASVDTQRGV